MIHIFPYLEHTIRTTKSPQEIHDILQSVTAPKKKWFSRTPGEFIGKIDQSDFKIMSNDGYRNAFFPVIKGAIKKGEGVYLVTLKMQHYPLTYIWFGIVGLLFLSAVRELMISKFTDVTMFLWTSGLVVYGQILARFGFNISAKEAIKRLEELLNAETLAAF